MKNTSRYAPGLVSGVPIAPMTSGAQPCIPAAPCGAEEASTSLRTMAGRISATCWAMKLPMEKPTRSAWLNSMAAMNAMASRAICSMVPGVAPVEPPTPALSKVTTRRERARASISAGSQLSRLPRKCWSRTSGTGPSLRVSR